MQAVPAAELDETAHRLATDVAQLPEDLVAQNKPACDKANELMGRALLQELARKSGAMAHRSPAAQEFERITGHEGLRAAVAWPNGGGVDARPSSGSGRCRSDSCTLTQQQRAEDR